MAAELARRRTTQGSAIRLLVLVLQGAATLLIVPISLHYLGSDDYAVSIVVRNVGLYLALAAEIGLGQTIVNHAGAAFARNDQREFNAVVTSGLILYIILAALVLVAGSIAMVFLPLPELLLGASGPAYPHLPVLLAVYATLVVVVVPLNVFPAALVAVREVRLRYALDGVSVLFAFFAATLPLIFGLGLSGLIFGSALGTYVTYLGAIWLVRRDHPSIRLRRVGVTVTRLRNDLANSAFFLVLAIGLMTQRTAATLVLAQHALLADVPVAYVLVVVYRISAWSLLDLVSRAAQPFVIYFETIGLHERVVAYAALGTKIASTLALTLVLVLMGLGSAIFRLIGLDVQWPELMLMGITLVIDALFITSLNVLVATNAHRRIAVVYLTYALASFVLGSAALSLPFRPIVSVSIGLLAAGLVSQVALLPSVMSRAFALSVAQYTRRFLLGPVMVATLGLAVAGAIHAASPDFDALDLLLAPLVGAVTWRGVLDPEERALCLAFWPLRHPPRLRTR